MSKKQRRKQRRALYCLLCALCATRGIAATPAELESAFQAGRWDDTIQAAYDLLRQSPELADAKLKGAYALFQKRYKTSALKWLRGVSPKEWESVPDGWDKLMEILALFKEGVPAGLAPWTPEKAALAKTSPYLKDELYFALGREAMARHDDASALEMLAAVSASSRFRAQARYTLGALLVKQGEVAKAERELSLLADSEAPGKAGEFGAKISSHWGQALRALVEDDARSRTATAGELATLALARLAYAKGDFAGALSHYAEIAPDSRFAGRAGVESAWALVLLGRYDEAAATAAKAARGRYHFTSVKARLVRALALAYAGHGPEARDEADAFVRAAEPYREALVQFERVPDAELLPEALKEESLEDSRLRALARYQRELKGEITALGKESVDQFPAYGRMAVELIGIEQEAQVETNRRTAEYFTGWSASLERMILQARLVRAESYLAEADRARAALAAARGADVRKDAEERVQELVGKAVAEQARALKDTKEPLPNVELRQAELQWELGKREEALAAAKDVVARTPQFAGLAQALFFIGYAELEQGRGDAGIAALEAYLAKFPRHASAPDAYRILADIRYDASEFQGARDYYRQVLSFKDSPLQGYASYKAGWCAYRLGDFEEALASLKQGILLMKKREPGSQATLPGGEAVKDLISLYAEVGDHRRALEYFTVILGSGAPEALAELARVLEEIGELEKASDVHRGLIALQPASGENLARQAAIVRLAFKRKRWQETVEEAQRLAYRYAKDLKPASAAPAAADAEKLLREILVAIHEDLKDAASPDDAKRIGQLDRLYLDAFRDWKESQEPLWIHALWAQETQQDAEALASFRRHWESFGARLAEPLREESLRRLLFSLEDAEAPEKGGSALSKTATDILAYAAQYLRAYPETRYTRSVAFLRASMLLKYRRYEEGIRDSQAIVDAGLTDDIGRKAYRNLKTAYVNRKQWKETYDWATMMVARERMDLYKAELQTLRRESAFLYAEGLPTDAAAAEAFLKIAQDDTMDPIREAAFHNAFLRFDKAGKKTEALKAAEQLEAFAPQSELVLQISGHRAAIHQDAGDYAKALPFLEVFLANAKPDTPAAAVMQARLNAGLIAEALDKREDAVRFFTQLVDDGGADTGAALVAEARNGLVRLGAAQERAVAAASPKWDALAQQRAKFEAEPIPKRRQIAQALQEGGARLQKIAKAYLDYSRAKGTPGELAYEAFCAVPLLYSAYTKAIVSLADASPDALKGELMMLVTPLEEQARKLGEECIQKSADAEHEGELYRKVVETWGWEHDPGLKFLVTRLLEAMAKHNPWLEKRPLDLSEEQLVERHLAGQGNADTWYTLGRRRWEDGKFGLARLTFVDALARTGSSGRALNALACLEQGQPRRRGITKLFEDAAKGGSIPAWANLAYRHLKAGRLGPALPALEAISRTELFAKDPEVNAPAQELLVAFRR